MCIYVARAKGRVKIIKGKHCKNICSINNETADYILITQKGIFILKLLSLMNTFSTLTVKSGDYWILNQFIRELRTSLKDTVKKQVKSRLFLSDLATQIESKFWSTGCNLPYIPVIVFAPPPIGVYVDTGVELLPLANGKSYMDCYFTTCKRFISFIKDWSKDNTVSDEDLEKIVSCLNCFCGK